LDPVAEQTQHGKQQRERIIDDNVYFTSGKPPGDAPSWTIDENFTYEPEQNITYETDIDIEYVEKDDEYSTNGEEYLNEEYYEEEYYYEDDEYYDDGEYYDDAGYFLESDFIMNSAEMNLPRPEDMDEVGESSTSQVSQIFIY
jgi:hypothetical protein